MRNYFDRQLELLNQELINMGAMCEQAIQLIVCLLKNHDSSGIHEIENIENEIDRKESSIESICLKMLLRQQPVARDLRQISAALKMITDMERIGDQAQDIAEIIPYVEAEHYPLDEICRMAEAVALMVTRSIDAYVKQDLNLALDVMKSDDKIDTYFDQIKKELIEKIQKQTTQGESVMDVLMIAKYFERIGDHAVNIAEWVQFAITGIHKGEETL